MARMTDQRRPTIADLKKTGRPLTLTGENGSMDVWIQKLGPDDIDAIVTKARAARVVADRKYQDRESEEYLAVLEGFIGWEPETLIEFLVNNHKASELEDKVAAEVAYSHDSEWFDEKAGTSIIDDLRAAWIGDDDTPGLKLAYARDPEDPDALRVFSEMQRFIELVDIQIEQEADQYREFVKVLPLDELRNEVAKVYIEIELDQVYRHALEYAQIWRCTRQPDDPDEFHFNTYAEVRRVDEDHRNQILEAYRSIAVDVIEGKELPATPSSSPSSGEAGPTDTETSSPAASPA